jgi:hypothetical protein
VRSAPAGGQHNLTSEVPPTRRLTCPTLRLFPIRSSAARHASGLGAQVELRWAIDQQPQSVAHDSLIVRQDGSSRCRPCLPAQLGPNDLRQYLD